jgi:hypothetical protein
LLGMVVAAGSAWWLAGRRPAPAGGLAQLDWPQLPGARPAGAGVRLAESLRSRLPRRKRASPEATAPPGARTAHAQDRLIAKLTSERRLVDRAGAAVALSKESDAHNGHRASGNGFGKVGGDLGHQAGARGGEETNR